MSQSSRSGGRVWTLLAVSVLLAVLFLQLAFSARRNSITWDEDDHIYAGYMSWKHADFGLNPEHPPLIKLVSTLPLLNMPLKLPPCKIAFSNMKPSLAARTSCSRTMPMPCS